MEVAAFFGMTVAEFQSVIVYLTIANFCMLIHYSWQRYKIKDILDKIEMNYQSALDLANSIDNKKAFGYYKDIKNYNKLSNRNDWYIFGLMNLAQVNNHLSNEDKIDILESFRYIAGAWCCRPEDVSLDFFIILEHITSEKNKGK